MNEQISLPRPAAAQTGRPTRETARRRQAELLERALEMFSEHGFEVTTIDAIASSLNMTKRTIYARYKDKSALFEAAVNQSIDQWTVPLELLRSADTGKLETTLVAVARLRMANNLSPQGIRLQRIVTTEAFRFPEVFSKYHSASMIGIQFLTEVFEKYRADEPGEWFPDPALAASAFLSILNNPVRRALLLGKPPRPAELDNFIQQAVALFLNGIRPRN